MVDMIASGGGHEAMGHLPQGWKAIDDNFTLYERDIRHQTIPLPHVAGYTLVGKHADDSGEACLLLYRETTPKQGKFGTYAVVKQFFAKSHQAFQREAVGLETAARHDVPSPRLHHASKRNRYIVMSLIEGMPSGDYFQALHQASDVPYDARIAHVQAVAANVLDSIQRLFLQGGISHNDIKKANIVLRPSTDPATPGMAEHVLIDYGHARPVNTTDGGGTFFHLPKMSQKLPSSPEKYNERRNLYALAITILSWLQPMPNVPVDANSETIHEAREQWITEGLAALESNGKGEFAGAIRQMLANDEHGEVGSAFLRIWQRLTGIHEEIRGDLHSLLDTSVPPAEPGNFGTPDFLTEAVLPSEFPVRTA